ncbi:MAG TPA: diguanylate cyclase [Candidatus Omnitrophota bacterium]|nr:diguanylate cyclase [Candidatus Omnitrophota bacterium]HPT06858.1 diguanylate cyclase [Candidatus Omnitrophota bacterium]
MKEDFSLATRNLRYKLKIAFYLMLVLPLLVSTYLVANYILPKFGFEFGAIAALVVSGVIAIGGFFIIKEVFDRIMAVTTQAKLIAAGDITREIAVSRVDEVGDLGQALNQLTGRIRVNMEELKGFSEKTAEINLEIQKRVLVLSNLLQVSSLISQGAKIDDVLKITTEKSRLLAQSDISFLFFRAENQDTLYLKAAEGPLAMSYAKLILDAQDIIFKRVVMGNKQLVVDKENKLSADSNVLLQDKFKIKNALILPVYLKSRVIGVLGIGNNKDAFSYKKDDTELLDIFAKQIAISVENDFLMHRIEKLEIKDALTGLYNEAFIHSRLQEEIKRSISYQRPCGFIILNIDDFQNFHTTFGSLQAEAVLKKIASLIRDSVSEIDRVGRVGDNEFAIILPEKNKRQAQTVAEDVRKKIAFSFGEEQDVAKRLTVSAGISENPLDGINADDLFAKAKASLSLAKMQGKNRVSG